MEPIHTLSAVELAASMRRRELSPVEIVDAHIRRIEAVNPRLNALAAERFDRAMDEARRAEDTLGRRGPHPPLLGVPCSIKEFLAVEGMPQTAGCVRRRGRRSDADAPLVARLRAAGAIVLGVSNAPEGGLWYETDNPVYGRTHNPWDLHRTPGGSSGGEGALIASGASVFGIGSDTGGSIRIPAGFCGIAGHKPTGGVLPNTGHYPPAPPGPPMMVCGPMARDATDLWPLMQILAGPDGVDPQCTRTLLGRPDEVDLREVTVYPLESNGRTRPRPEVREAVRRATEVLVDRGARIGRLSTHALDLSFEIWAAMLEASGSSYDDLVGDGRPIAFWRQLARWPLGRSDHSGAVMLLLGIERLGAHLGDALGPLLPLARQLRDSLEAQLGPNGLIVHPVYTRAAPRHRAMLLQPPRDVACTTLFNVTTFPVTVVPAGVDPRGMPIGVQLAAIRGRDALTIAAAEAVQADLGRLGPVDPRVGRPAPLGMRLIREAPPR